MSTWVIFLIGVGIAVLLAGLGYVIWRWGTKKAQLTNFILTSLSGVLSVVKEFFVDNPDKLDFHDFLEAAMEVSNALSVLLKKLEAGAMSLDVAKVDLTATIKAVAGKFPGLSAVLTDTFIEKEVAVILGILYKQ